jgi:diguanylate cyclase (GGDEF)-like protein
MANIATLIIWAAENGLHATDSSVSGETWSVSWDENVISHGRGRITLIDEYGNRLKIVGGPASVADAIGLVADRIPPTSTASELMDEMSNVMNVKLETWRYRALHDELTGVSNRGGLTEWWKYGRKSTIALFLIDLNEFKLVNDKYGHAVGDELLKRIGRDLENLDGDITVARIAGDEFVLATRTTPARTANDIKETIDRERIIAANRIVISAAIGVTEELASDLVETLERADLAMYHAKLEANESESSIRWWLPDMRMPDVVYARRRRCRDSRS